MDDDDDLKRRGEGASQSSRTAASIESARRFLYDEDELPLGNQANAVVSTTSRTSLSTTQLGGDEGRRRTRLSPIYAVLMAALSSIRNLGTKRIMILLVAAAIVLTIVLLCTDNSQSPIRTKKLRNKVIDAGISSQNDLTNSKSPQYHALKWLANVDKSSADDDFVLQRYALAVLYYTTADSLDHDKPEGCWHNQVNWLTNKGFCSWHGVECGMKNSAFDGNDHVTSLVLPENQLRGTLPSELVALEKLVMLDLTGNLLTSTLPTQLPIMAQLNFLHLGKNKLHGTIPGNYGQFASLREMDLGHNELEGSIPLGLYAMKGLRKLGLEYNKFEGPITNEVNGLEKISKLWREPQLSKASPLTNHFVL